ncbi:hypothetical protein [Streptomyces sp. NPDC001750]|uniref:hypothetical protein n=1 Tax=Streptomyces sp. NPDC001750 TaxID=3364607 RepID=UPI00369B3816
MGHTRFRTALSRFADGCVTAGWCRVRLAAAEQQAVVARTALSAAANHAPAARVIVLPR